MNEWQQKLFDRLPEPLRKDAKQTCVLAGLGVVFAGVMLKQFGGALFASTVPQATPAASVAPAAASAVSLSSPGASTAGNDARGGGRVARWLATPGRPLDRNVFTMHLENFQSVAAVAPPAASSGSVSVRVVEDQTFWDQLAKSLGARADQKKQRQIRTDNLQMAAARIRVNSTILGPRPGAMIDGRLRRAGDTVEAQLGSATLAFRIVQIEARRIVVERDGVRLELTLTGEASVIAVAPDQ